MSQPTPFDLEVVINDAEGKPHSYQIRSHPTAEGLDLMVELVGLGAEPIGRLIEGALKAEDVAGMLGRALSGAVEEGEVGAGDVSALGSALQGLDLAAVGRDLRGVLATAKAAPLLQRLVRHSFRDGQSLAHPPHFAAAYQRNYFELLQAAWQVIRVNRFFPLPGIS
jgi:hypothetical protein